MSTVRSVHAGADEKDSSLIAVRVITEEGAQRNHEGERDLEFFVMVNGCDDGPPVNSDEVVTVPITVLVDVSSSMRGAPIEKVKDVLLELLEVIGEQGRRQFTLITFSSRAEVVQLGEDWKATIRRIHASGSTAMYDALDRARRLAVESSKPHANRLVILLSDGAPNVGHANFRAIESGLTLGARAAWPSEMVLSTVGFGVHHNPVLLQQLATRFGGRFAYCSDAATASEIWKEFVHFAVQCSNNVALNVILDVVLEEGWMLAEQTFSYRYVKISERQHRFYLGHVAQGQITSLGVRVLRAHEGCRFPPFTCKTEFVSAETGGMRTISTQEVVTQSLSFSAEKLRASFVRMLQSIAAKNMSSSQIVACISAFLEQWAHSITNSNIGKSVRTDSQKLSEYVRSRGTQDVIARSLHLAEVYGKKQASSDSGACFETASERSFFVGKVGPLIQERGSKVASILRARAPMQMSHTSPLAAQRPPTVAKNRQVTPSSPGSGVLAAVNKGASRPNGKGPLTPSSPGSGMLAAVNKGASRPNGKGPLTPSSPGSGMLAATKDASSDPVLNQSVPQKFQIRMGTAMMSVLALLLAWFLVRLWQ